LYDLLRRSLASQDKRWLLPTMFEITAGLKGINIALKPEHIKKVEELGFLTSDENVLTLGERSRLMGTEIITSWLGSISCQAYGFGQWTGKKPFPHVYDTHGICQSSLLL
jgi:hypothetical protein